MSKFWNGNIGEFSWFHFMPVKQWYDVIGEKTVADAILDRIVHVAQRIELKGDSLRKRKSEVENAEE